LRIGRPLWGIAEVAGLSLNEVMVLRICGEQEKVALEWVAVRNVFQLCHVWKIPLDFFFCCTCTTPVFPVFPQ
jgi:hypothetical protein